MIQTQTLAVLGQALLGLVLFLCLHNFKQVETKILSRLSKTTFTWLSKRLVVGQSAHWIQNLVQFASYFYTSVISEDGFSKFILYDNEIIEIISLILSWIRLFYMQLQKAFETFVVSLGQFIILGPWFLYIFVMPVHELSKPWALQKASFWILLSCQKWQNSDFQSQFSMSKIIRIFLIFFSLKNMILGAHFLLLTFFENFNF